METGMQVMSKPFAIDDLAARIKTMLTEKPG
jgi:DNA-binding response OmpR family regulator